MPDHYTIGSHGDSDCHRHLGRCPSGHGEHTADLPDAVGGDASDTSGCQCDPER
jgi:hypothetical protein